MTTFPSHAHQKDLRKLAAVWGKDRYGNAIVVGYEITKLGSDLERRQYFAYDHAFHRLTQGDRAGSAPTDPHKTWWDDRLVDQAEAQLKAELGWGDPPGNTSPPRPNPPTKKSEKLLDYDSFVQSLGVKTREKKD